MKYSQEVWSGRKAPTLISRLAKIQRYAVVAEAKLKGTAMVVRDAAIFVSVSGTETYA